MIKRNDMIYRKTDSMIFGLLLVLFLFQWSMTAGAGNNTGSGSAQTNSNLLNTYWKLVQLDGGAVNVATNEREMHMVLEQVERKVHGFTGCNRFFGTYQHVGDQLAFSRMGMTRMACLHGMENEGLFMRALEHTVRYRINAETLTLLDAGGGVVARFEARSTP